MQLVREKAQDTSYHKMLSSRENGTNLLFDWYSFKEIQGSRVKSRKKCISRGTFRDNDTFVTYHISKEFSMAEDYLTYLYYSTLYSHRVLNYLVLRC